MELIEKILNDLNAIIEDESDVRLSSTELVQSLETAIFADYVDFEIGALLLFANDNPPSLLKFIANSGKLKDKEVLRARVNAGKLLGLFYRRYPESSDLYVVPSLLSLLEIFRKDDSAEVKKGLLAPVKNILRIRLPHRVDEMVGGFNPSSLDPDTIALEGIYRSLIEDMKYSKKKSKGVQSEILKVLGLLIGVFPGHAATLQYSREIIDHCLSQLNSNFTSKSGEVDFMIIAGAFSCLDRILHHFDDAIGNRTADVWKWLLQASFSACQAEVSRYSAAAKALRCIKNHAGLFVDVIGLNAERSYDKILQAHRAIKDATKKHSADALHAVMDQIGSFVAMHQGDGTRALQEVLTTVNSLLTGFLNALKSFTESDSSESIQSALQGVISIAPALTMEDAVGSSSTLLAIIESAKSFFSYMASNDRTSSDVKEQSGFLRSLQCLYFEACVSVLFSLFISIRTDRHAVSFFELISHDKIRMFFDEYGSRAMVAYTALWRKGQKKFGMSIFKLLFVFTHVPVRLQTAAVPENTKQSIEVLLGDMKESMLGTLSLRSIGRKENDERFGADSVLISPYTMEPETRLLFVYKPLWTEVLSPSHTATRTRLAASFGFDIMDRMGVKILDELCHRLVMTIGHLDLSLIRVDIAAGALSLMPNNLVDQELLINAMDFLAFLLFGSRPEFHHQVTPTLIRKLQELSLQHPFISAFYRGIGGILRLDAQIALLEDDVAEYLYKVQSNMEASSEIFAGELLVSVLQMIFSFPVDPLNIVDVLPALEMSLRSGHCLASCIKIMHALFVRNPEDFIAKGQDLLVNLRKYADNLKGDMTLQTEQVVEGGEKINVGHLLLDFLGRLGGVNEGIIANPTEAIQDSLVIASKKCLIVDVYLPAATSTSRAVLPSQFSFDAIVSQLIATYEKGFSANIDEQYFTILGETMHAVVGLVLGKMSTAMDRQKGHYAPYFTKLLSLLIRFASKESASRIVNEQLALQIARLAGREQNALDSAEVLDSMLQVICATEKESASTALCVRCVEEMVSVGGIARVVYDKVATLLSLPRKEDRRGGIALLQKLTAHMRENWATADLFGLRLLYLTLRCLKLPQSELQHQEAIEVLVPFREVIVRYCVEDRYHDNLQRVKEERGTPSSLPALVQWCLERALTSTEKIFRRECMLTFTSLAVFAGDNLLATFGYFDNLAIASEVSQTWASSLGHRSILEAVNARINNALEVERVEEALVARGDENLLFLQWLERFSAAMDAYAWLLTVQLVSARELWASQDDRANNEGSFLLHRVFANFLPVLYTIGPAAFTDEANTIILESWKQLLSLLSGLLKDEPSALQWLTRNNVITDDFSIFLLQSYVGFVGVDKSLTATEDILDAVDEFLRVLCRDAGFAHKFTTIVVKRLRDINAESKETFIARLDRAIRLAVKENVFTTNARDKAALFQDLVTKAVNIACEDGAGQTKHKASGSTLLHLAFDIIGDSEVNFDLLLSTLCDPSNSATLLTSYSADIVQRSVDANSPALSLFTAGNMRKVLGRLDVMNITSWLEAVLLHCADRLSMQASEMDVDWTRAVHSMVRTLADTAAMLSRFPLRMIVILTGLNSQLSLIDANYSEMKLYRFVLENCCRNFSKSAKVPVEDLVTYLSLVPHIIGGTTDVSPRPLQQFPDNPVDIEKLGEALEELVATKFPLESKLLSPSSEPGKSFLIIFNGYFEAFAACGSPLMLQPLLPTFREGANHVYYPAILRALSSVARSQSSDDVQLLGVRKISALCLQHILNPHEEMAAKKIFFESLLLPTLQALPSDGLITIFAASAAGDFLSAAATHANESTVKNLVDLLQEIKPAGKSPEQVSTEVFMQIFAFKMLELLYDRCALKDIKGELTQAYVGQGIVATGKELTQAICKIAFKAVRASLNSHGFESLLDELYAAAYQCLAVVVAKTQSEEQFYDNFLFKEKAGEDMWGKIIGRSFLAPSVQQDIISPVGSFATIEIGKERGYNERTERLSRARRIALKSRLGCGKSGFLSQYMHSSMVSQSGAIAATQGLSQATGRTQSQLLAGDYVLSQYDTANIKGVVAAAGVANHEYDADQAGLTNVVGWDNQKIYLELNHYNRYPVMSTMLRVLKRMYSLFGAKWIQNRDVLPKWLHECYARLQDFSAPQRVRLFMLRFFLNQPVAAIIAPWAKDLLPGILECAVRDLCMTAKPGVGSQSSSSAAAASTDNADEAPPNFYGYFLRDVVFTICDSWKNAELPTFATDWASQLMTFLLNNVLHINPDIAKENVLSVVALIRLWSSTGKLREIKFNMDKILDLAKLTAAISGGAHASIYSAGSISVRSRLVASEIWLTLLECEYPILEKSQRHGDVAKQLVDAVITGVKFPRKEVMEAYCQLGGRILVACDKLKEKGKAYDLCIDQPQVTRFLLEAMESLIAKKDGISSYVTCLKNVISIYPSFLRRECVLKTMNSVSRLASRQKYEFLMTLVETTSILDDLDILEIFRPYFQSLLTDLSTVAFGRGARMVKIPVVQVFSILLLVKYSDGLTVEVLSSLFGSSDVEGLRQCISRRSSLQTRYAAFTFLLKLCETRPELQFNRRDDDRTTRNLRTTVYQLLLQGLMDSDDNGSENTEGYKPLTPADYVDINIWSPKNTKRMGIRNLVAGFVHRTMGVQNIKERILFFLKTFYDPLNSESWLRQTTTLLLFTILSSPTSGQTIFPNNFALEDRYQRMDVKSLTQRAIGASGSTLSSQTPLFALERTTAAVSQMMSQNKYSQAKLSQQNISATQEYMSQSGKAMIQPSGAAVSTQGRTAASQRSNIRGTQQVSWMATQGSKDHDQEDGTQTSDQTIDSEVTVQRVPMRYKSSAVDASSAKAKISYYQSSRNLAKETAAKKKHVTFSREYREGDVPDIAITRKDLFAPLLQLCLLNDSFAVTIFHSIVEMSIGAYSKRDNRGNLDQPFIEDAKLLMFEFGAAITRSQGAGVSYFVGSALLSCYFACSQSIVRSVDLAEYYISDDDIAAVGKDTGNVYLALQILETKLLRSRDSSSSADNAVMPPPSAKKEEPATKKRKGGKGKAGSAETDASITTDDLMDTLGIASAPSQRVDFAGGSSLQGSALMRKGAATSSTQINLMKLYDSLKENEIMVSLSMTVAEGLPYSNHLKIAIDAEIRGDFALAAEEYNTIIEQYSKTSTKKRQISSEEDEVNTTSDNVGVNALWSERAIGCLEKLGRWDEMLEKINNNPQNDTSKSLFAMQRRMNGLYHVYIDHQETENDVNRAAKNLVKFLNDNVFDDMEIIGDENNKLSTRQMLEAVSAIDLSASCAALGDWARSWNYAERAFGNFVDRWCGLHPCSYKARQSLALQLQQIVELRDVVTVKTKGVKALFPLLTAGRSNPSQALVNVWSSSEPGLADPVSHWLEVSAIRKSALLEQELPPLSCLHLSRMNVRTAIAAISQGTLSVVKPLLEKNNALRRRSFAGRAILTMQEAELVFNYHKASIFNQRLGSEESQTMLTKTANMLAKKMEMLEEVQTRHTHDQAIVSASRAEKLQVKFLQGKWHSFWAEYDLDSHVYVTPLRSTANTATAHASVVSKHKLALHSFLEGFTLLSQGVNQVKFEVDCYTALSEHCESLLQEMETGGLQLSSQEMLPLALQAFNQDLLGGSLNQVSSGSDVVASLLVLSYLHGLRLGSSYAKERLLRLVQTVHRYRTATFPLFMKLIQTIPAHAFLRYAAQLMGYLDQPEGDIVVPILEKTAKMYPTALLYPYRITKESFGRQGRELSQRLELLLRSEIVDTFIEALSCFTHPELRWSDGLKEIEPLLKKLHTLPAGDKKARTSLSQDITALFRDLRSRVLTVSWPLVGSKIGRYNIQFANEIRKKVDAIVGKNDEKLLTLPDASALKAITEDREMEFAGGKVPLLQFSDWLAELSNQTDATRVIEIPGQYARYSTSDIIPQPELHEAIAAVDSQVLVMGSIRKPKRLKLHGTLGTEFLFLVKGGEDLRNDERIEQLFVLMNHVLYTGLNKSKHRDYQHSISVDELLLLPEAQRPQPEKKKATVRHNSAWCNNSASSAGSAQQQHRGPQLAARTYCVIPMSTRVGLLEWVKHTVPLKAIIAQELARDPDFPRQNPGCLPRAAAGAEDDEEREVNLSEIKAYKERFAWIKSHGAVEYHKMFKNAPEQQARELYDRIVGGIPPDLLRRRLLALTRSSEGFYTMRGEYARTLAISSLFGYILGLGDRHLENLLLDVRSGGLVQIDFGICFGMGASVLPVPEFFPFRLTPQLRNALLPLDGTQLLRTHMVTAMDILRKDSGRSLRTPLTALNGDKAVEQGGCSQRGVIANALEIYIFDPVVDWLRGISARDKDELRLLRESAEDGSESSSSQGGGQGQGWEPARRVRLALRKLMGEDPVSLLVEDLSLNPAIIKLKTLPGLQAAIEAARKDDGNRPTMQRMASIGTVDVMGSQQALAAASQQVSWADLKSMSQLQQGTDTAAAGAVGATNEGRSKSVAKEKSAGVKPQQHLLAVGDQVDQLIALAVDGNILVRQWTGLQTWL